MTEMVHPRGFPADPASEACLRFDPVHDAHYCIGFMVWVDEICTDPECTYCPSRPTHPHLAAARAQTGATDA